MFKVKLFVLGQVAVNCYLLYDENTKEALIIDPGANSEVLLAYLHEHELNLQTIVNTHGHFDHIGANDALIKKTGATLFIHKDDQSMLKDSKANLSLDLLGEEIVSNAKSIVVKEGDYIQCGDHAFLIIHVPGHSPGSICLYEKGTLFSGDTIFLQSIGRCDFEGGSEELLIKGIKEKLLVLPENTKVYPGHGPFTNIGWEKEHNFFLKEGFMW